MNSATAARLTLSALAVALALTVAAPDDAGRTAAVVHAQTRPAGQVDDQRIKKAARDEPGAWLAYGQTYDENRFSSLTQIDRTSVKRLGLAWSKPLGERHRLQGTPLIVDGVMYVTDPWNVMYALDAKTGREIWTYDPKTDREYVRYSCCGGPSNRGVAVYGGRVYEATYDGRLIAVDAATGTLAWQVDTYHPSARSRFNITGAPRAAAGKIFIGQGSSEFGVRGYVSAYDANTGALAWRFYLVPGDPSKPFEHPEVALAAKTWKGDWWKYGGGGTVWNSIVYDADLHTLYLGVGNGAPWPRRVRAKGGGDNLFLTAIVAVHPDTGRMKWYYQTVPGDNWDYSAAMDMALAEMVVDGRKRKVLLQAPKNGFFYVLDRTNGKPLRAHPFTAGITWATGVDLRTGRPTENRAVVYEEKPQWILPGNSGAHNWQPMSFDASRGVMYLGVHDLAFFYALPEQVERGDPFEMSKVGMSLGVANGPYRDRLAEGQPRPEPRAYLKAFEPLTGKTRWVVQHETTTDGGVLATAGGLVFAGEGSGVLSAYDSDDGARLWRFDSHGSIVAAPVTYTIDGTQYVAVLASARGDNRDGGRLLVFALDSHDTLPEPRPRDLTIPEQPPMTASPEDLARGDQLYHEVCANCHGGLGRSYTVGAAVPDLRRMSAATHRAFNAIVLEGARRPFGMPGFADVLTQQDAERIHQFAIAEANNARARQKP